MATHEAKPARLTIHRWRVIEAQASPAFHGLLLQPDEAFVVSWNWQFLLDRQGLYLMWRVLHQAW
jgi:hypothetical protein